MNTLQKCLAVLAVVSVAILAALPAARAQDAADTAQLDALFAELAEPDRPDWERVESEIIRLLSRSGSASMDLLLRRGNEAMENENYEQALEHLSALVDHAPGFAEGWNTRATVYFLLGEYSLSIADVERVLALEPRHFGALAGLGFMFEEMGEHRLALSALRAAQAINPNRSNISESIDRLERETGAADL
jgi:tetratricopeptide (TPR) repeat protein